MTKNSLEIKINLYFYQNKIYKSIKFIFICALTYIDSTLPLICIIIIYVQQSYLIEMDYYRKISFTKLSRTVWALIHIPCIQSTKLKINVT